DRIVGLRDVHVPAAIRRETSRVAERRPCRQKRPARAEFFDAGKVLVRDIYVSAAVGRDAGWVEELSVPTAVRAPCHQERPTRAEFLDPIVTGVRDVDVPARVRPDSGRGRELSGTAA